MIFFDRRKTKPLTIEEATTRLYYQISENINWKLIKSQRCIKKVIGDLVFQIDFYSSKWNESYKNIEIQCECQLWCKKFDKELSTKSQVGYYKFTSMNNDWWNITNENNLLNTVEKLCKKINQTIIPLSKYFENNFLEATKKLANEEIFNTYNIRLEFIDIYAGRESVINIAKKYYDSLSDIIKQDIIRYKQGARDKAWMINPSNLKYIIDNNIV